MVPMISMTLGNFYPRPPRGGRPLALSLEPCDQLISIHALREEGDANTAKQRVDFFISIHALREEGDKYWMQGREPEFNFYPRPPRGGRRPWLIRFTMQSYFYPRPPRGGRRGIKGGIAKGGVFLSTPSARRATPVMLATPDRSTISIHALREEGDVRL